MNHAAFDAAADRALVERAAQAAFQAFGHDVARPMPWDEAPEDFRITFRLVADAVLTVARAAPPHQDPDDDLRATVARVAAVCDRGVFDVTRWGERGTPFSNGAERAFAAVRAALDFANPTDPATAGPTQGEPAP